MISILAFKPKKIFQILFTSSLFLLHIPYYYLLPIHFAFVNSYALSRITTILMFCLAILHPFFRKYRTIQYDAVFLLLAVTFVCQSLSIISSSNIQLFLGRFEDLFFTLMFYYCCVIFIKTAKPKFKMIFIYFLLIAINISLIDELAVFFFSKLYLAFARIFLHPSQLEFITVNLFRDRLYVNRYHEALIPFLVFFILSIKRAYKKYILGTTIVLIFLLALISGWRIRLVAALFSFIGTIAVLFPHRLQLQAHKVPLIILGIIILFVAIISTQFMHRYLGYSTFGRLTFESEEDIEALTSRLDFFDKSLYLLRSFLFFGVGLGHYHIVGTDPLRTSRSLFKEQDLQYEEVALSPHNIIFQSFAEAGLVGTIPFLILFLYCVFTDINSLFILKNSTRIQKIAIVSFWSLFLFSQFHSPMGFHYYALLFGIRAVIRYIK